MVDVLGEEVAFLVGHGDWGDGAAGVVLGVGAVDLAVGNAVHGHASRCLDGDGDHAAGKAHAGVDDGAFLGGGEVASDADGNLGGVSSLVGIGDGAIEHAERSGERVGGNLTRSLHALIPARDSDARGNLNSV